MAYMIRNFINNSGWLQKFRLSNPPPQELTDTERQPESSDPVHQSEGVPKVLASRLLPKCETLYQALIWTVARIVELATDNNTALDSWKELMLSPESLREPDFDKSRLQCQKCFICFKKRNRYHAIPIPCFHPTNSYFGEFDPYLRELSVPVKHEESSRRRESHSEIYIRIREALFTCKGRWKQWLPFYGIINVTEIEFQFYGSVEEDGSLPIHVRSLNLRKIKAEYLHLIKTRKINMEDIIPDDDTVDFCNGEEHHTDECYDEMQNQYLPCILERVEYAERKVKNLKELDVFKEVARNPRKANQHITLQGMAGTSLIYGPSTPENVVIPAVNQAYKDTARLRGLLFTLGWQTDRFAHELSFNIAISYWIAIAIPWVGVALWAKPKGDWATALSFGQLIAASVALVWLKCRE